MTCTREAAYENIISNFRMPLVVPENHCPDRCIHLNTVYDFLWNEYYEPVRKQCPSHCICANLYRVYYWKHSVPLESRKLIHDYGSPSKSSPQFMEKIQNKNPQLQWFGPELTQPSTFPATVPHSKSGTQGVWGIHSLFCASTHSFRGLPAKDLVATLGAKSLRYLIGNETWMIKKILCSLQTVLLCPG